MADYDPQTIEEWLSACEDCEGKLSSWETDFIANIRQRVENGRPLSESQVEKLQEIYDAKTG